MIQGSCNIRCLLEKTWTVCEFNCIKWFTMRPKWNMEAPMWHNKLLIFSVCTHVCTHTLSRTFEHSVGEASYLKDKDKAPRWGNRPETCRGEISSEGLGWGLAKNNSKTIIPDIFLEKLLFRKRQRNWSWVGHFCFLILCLKESSLRIMIKVFVNSILLQVRWEKIVFPSDSGSKL